MASGVAKKVWDNQSLAQQLGTDGFQCLHANHQLVQGRVKLDDCCWMHLSIDKFLLQQSERMFRGYI